MYHENLDRLERQDPGWFGISAEDIAVEAVRRQAEADEYGPLFVVEEIGEGHQQAGPDGICPTCGRLQAGSPPYEATRTETGVPYSVIRGACFEPARFTVEFTYNDQGHRALYGVPYEGAPTCWAS